MKIGQVVTVPNTAKLKEDEQVDGTIIDMTTTEFHVLDAKGYIHIVARKLAYPSQAHLTTTVSPDTLV